MEERERPLPASDSALSITHALAFFFELLLRVITLLGSKPDLSYPYLSPLQLHYRTERQEFRKI